MESLSNRAPADAELNLSPLDRFELLLQRFEHIVESRSDTVEGISIEVPGDEDGPTSWLRLGVYLEQIRGLHTHTADVYLHVRWGTTKDAFNMADVGISRTTLENTTRLDRQEEVMGLLEMSVTEAENIVFNLK